MNNESCAMRRFLGTIEQWWEAEPSPGDFLIHDSTVDQAEPECRPKDGQPTVTIKYFTVILPSGSTCTIPLRPVPQTGRPINGGHSWQWDGNEDKPTLTPSINAEGSWHGWVRSGRMESC